MDLKILYTISFLLNRKRSSKNYLGDLLFFGYFVLIMDSLG